jgi:hypothetical protein
VLKIKRKSAKCIVYIVRRNCLLIHVIEGKVEERIVVTGRRRRIRKQLMDNRKETRGY